MYQVPPACPHCASVMLDAEQYQAKKAFLVPWPHRSLRAGMLDRLLNKSQQQSVTRAVKGEDVVPELGSRVRGSHASVVSGDFLQEAELKPAPEGWCKNPPGRGQEEGKHSQLNLEVIWLRKVTFVCVHARYWGYCKFQSLLSGVRGRGNKRHRANPWPWFGGILFHNRTECWEHKAFTLFGLRKAQEAFT